MFSPLSLPSMFFFLSCLSFARNEKHEEGLWYLYNKMKFKTATSITNEDDILLARYNVNRINVTGIYLHLYEYRAQLRDPFNEMCLVIVAEHIPRVKISDLPWKDSPDLIWKESERRD